MKKVLLIVVLVIAAAAFYWFSRRPKEPPVSIGEVQAVFRDALPGKADDQIWQEAPVYDANLLLQDIVDPRLMKPSTNLVKVQSITNGREVAFLLRWNDATLNDTTGPAGFADACAVQLPSTSSADLPAPQMGEEGRRVEITYWSASWQASMSRKQDDIKVIHPNAGVDHYPFEAPSLSNTAEQQAMAQRYAPARALGNQMTGPRSQPVQDLIAEGPGTLTAASKTTSRGSAIRSPEGWNVLIVRSLPEPLRAVQISQVAFAVWEGSKNEVGARKMRTAWIPIKIGSKK